IAAAEPGRRDGDIVVGTAKIVSKAEGRIRKAASRSEAIERETVRVVARRGETVIAQTRHGLVMAAAGVDASNTERGTVLLLPEPAAAAARRRRRLPRRRRGVDGGVLVASTGRRRRPDRRGGGVGGLASDALGRPWREGLVDVAIGAAGVRPLEAHRGRTDAYGNPLVATVTALADEIAAAAELVKPKTAGVPVAVVRGL